MKNPTSIARDPTREFTAAALLLCGLFAGAAPSRADPASTSSKVALTDLNLATSTGMAQARVRIERAVKDVCLRVDDLNDLSHHDNYLACVSNALEQAQPALAALARQSAARLASAATP